MGAYRYHFFIDKGFPIHLIGAYATIGENDLFTFLFTESAKYSWYSLSSDRLEKLLLTKILYWFIVVPDMSILDLGRIKAPLGSVHLFIFKLTCLIVLILCPEIKSFSTIMYTI